MPHIHEKIDFTVEVFVVHNNKVLLRMHDKYKMWLSIGGHIELDEDPVEAAMREVKEEVGLYVKLMDNKLFEQDDEHNKQLNVPVSVNRHHINQTHEHVSFVYFGTSDSDEVIPEKPNDIWKWLTKEELETLDLRADIKFFAGKALETLAQ